VIFFSYFTVHWSNVNRTDKWRKSVRIGYHAPQMRPIGMDETQPNHKIMAGGLKNRGQEPKVTYR
jgi:hypothetical protein